MRRKCHSLGINTLFVSKKSVIEKDERERGKVSERKRTVDGTPFRSSDPDKRFERRREKRQREEKKDSVAPFFRKENDKEKRGGKWNQNFQWTTSRWNDSYSTFIMCKPGKKRGEQIEKRERERKEWREKERGAKRPVIEYPEQKSILRSFFISLSFPPVSLSQILLSPSLIITGLLLLVCHMERERKKNEKKERKEIEEKDRERKEEVRRTDVTEHFDSWSSRLSPLFRFIVFTPLYYSMSSSLSPFSFFLSLALSFFHPLHLGTTNLIIFLI